MSEKDAAAVRRDGGPLTIAEQQLWQEVAAVSKPPNQAQKEAAIAATSRTAGSDPGDGAKTGGYRLSGPTPPEPGRQKARPAGVAQPAAEGACDAS